MVRAYWWASVEIEIGKAVPKGALEIAASRSTKKLKEIIEVCARHAYDGVTLLVPGIPEADSQSDKILAFGRFREMVHLRLFQARQKGGAK